MRYRHAVFTPPRSLMLCAAFLVASLPVQAVAPSAASDDPCADALDAEQRGDVLCRSPGALDPAAVVEADAPTPAPAPLRDPTIFPAEIGFFAVVSAVAGAGAVAASILTENTQNSPTDELVRQGSFYAGVSSLGLAAGLGAAALSTYVFDVSTGKLTLSIFDNEPR